MARLVNATADYAAYNSTRRYASGEADFNREFPKVYSWAQCTPDLTRKYILEHMHPGPLYLAIHFLL